MYLGMILYIWRRILPIFYPCAIKYHTKMGNMARNRGGQCRFFTDFRTSLKATLSRKLVAGGYATTKMFHVAIVLPLSSKLILVPLPLLFDSRLDPFSTFICFGIAWFSVVHASVPLNWSGFWACLVDIFKWMHPPHVITLTDTRWMAFQTLPRNLIVITLFVIYKPNHQQRFFNAKYSQKRFSNWIENHSSNL